jgi:hypothetical protein
MQRLEPVVLDVVLEGRHDIIKRRLANVAVWNLKIHILRKINPLRELSNHIHDNWDQTTATD